MKAITQLPIKFFTALRAFTPKTVIMGLSAPRIAFKTPVTKTKILVGGVAMGLGVLGYHEFSAAEHTPTASSLIVPILGIMLHASSGLAKIEIKPSDGFSHPNRARLRDTPTHVSNVNIFCDEQGIPLDTILADLFLLHDQVKPEIGSALDMAFEREIISLFKKEFDEGMQSKDILKSIEEKLDDFGYASAQRKLNSFNAVGVGAHSFFSANKAFIYRLKTAALNASIIKDQLFSSDSMSSLEKYESDVETYQTQIRAHLDELESHIEQKRDNDIYKNDIKMEHSDRKRYIEKIASEFIAPQKLASKQQTIKEKLIEMQTSNSPEQEQLEQAPSSRK